MRKNTVLNAFMAATVVVGAIAGTALAYAPFSLDDSKDSGMTSYVAGRDLDVSSPGQSTLDLTHLRVVGPPMKLELALNNTSAHPVNVILADLKESYLVPANSHRVVYVSMLQVGQHTEVGYNVEQILEPKNTELSTASIQYILDSSYVQPWQGQSAYQPASRRTDAVRGH